jgi:hypothetical protein
VTGPGETDIPDQAPDPGGTRCPRVGDAGAYLLGALSPADRASYAEHLDGCGECLHEVGRLAGLPGLLAHAPSDPHRDAGQGDSGQADAGPGVRGPGERGPGSTGPGGRGPRAPVAEPPPDLVPGAVAAIRRYRARRRLAGAASVVVLAGIVLGGGVLFGRTTGAPGPQPVALPVHMQQVSAEPVNAQVGFAKKDWGTAINVRCRLDGHSAAASEVYVLVAVAKNGSTQELARWQARPDEDANIAAATDLPPDQLRALEIKADPSGSTVLRTEEV